MLTANDSPIIWNPAPFLPVNEAKPQIQLDGRILILLRISRVMPLALRRCAAEHASCYYRRCGSLHVCMCVSRTTIFQPVMIHRHRFLRTLLHHISCLSASPPVLFNKRWRLSPRLGFCAFTLHSHTPPPLISLYPSGRLSPDAGSGYTSIGLRLQPSLRAAACRSVSMTCLHAPPSSSVSPSLTSSLLCFILPHLLSMQTTVSVTQTLPLFLFFPTLPVPRYLPLPVSPRSFLPLHYPECY